MKQSIGPIFKLVREQKRVKLKEIAKQCSQPISKLSEFENGKKKFTEEELRALYQCLQLNYPSKDTMEEEVEQGCKQMFDSICYCEDKEGEILEALRKQKPMIFCDFSYITYLLCELLYCVYHPFQGDNSQTLIQIIESHIAYLSEEARTLFYDTAGVYYKNEK